MTDNTDDSTTELGGEPIRFQPNAIDINETGVEVCEHILLENAYIQKRGGCEYTSPIQIYCRECDERYEVTERIN